MGYAPPPAVERPSSIRTAVRLMLLGAGTSAIGILLTITDVVTGGSVASDGSLTKIGAAQVAPIVVIMFGLVGIGLWLGMAWVNGQGRSWARVIATILGGINGLGALFNLASAGSSTLDTTSAVVNLVLAATILALLYRPESSRYYVLTSG